MSFSFRLDSPLFLFSIKNTHKNNEKKKNTEGSKAFAFVLDSNQICSLWPWPIMPWKTSQVLRKWNFLLMERNRLQCFFLLRRNGFFLCKLNLSCVKIVFFFRSWITSLESSRLNVINFRIDSEQCLSVLVLHILSCGCDSILAINVIRIFRCVYIVRFAHIARGYCVLYTVLYIWDNWNSVISV